MMRFANPSLLRMGALKLAALIIGLLVAALVASVALNVALIASTGTCSC